MKLFTLQDHLSTTSTDEMTMQSDDFLQLLMTHAGQSEGERLADGILGMLRPYNGIIERNIHEVVNCLYRLHGELRAEFVRNDIIRSSMSILITMRNWAMLPTSMLRSNQLIDDSSLIRLGNWYDVIETATIRYMSSSNHARALYKYMEYLVGYDAIDVIADDAVSSAVSESFALGEDYQIVPLSLCVKYPQIGRQFRSEVARRFSTVSDDELRTLMVNFLDQISEIET